MKKFTIAAASFVTLALPAVAFAATSLTTLILETQRILGMLIPLAITAALLAFFWGLIKYVWSGGGEKHEEGRKIMIAGIVALFIMVSVWGIIRAIQVTLSVDNNTGTIQVPRVPGY